MLDLTKVLHLQRRFQHTANSLSDIWMCFPVEPARQTKLVVLASFEAEPMGEKPLNQLVTFHMQLKR